MKSQLNQEAHAHEHTHGTFNVILVESVCVCVHRVRVPSGYWHWVFALGYARWMSKVCERRGAEIEMCVGREN